jgi:lipopolysaccharide/colanic/teichoic acid biosynthesis glycosyltransferase
MLFVAFVIKIVSPGPVLFKQKRIGLNGREFDLVKFRTMRHDAEEILSNLKEYHQREGLFVQMKNDPRIFEFGKILRKLSLDELPQLLNILSGSMSLVGPRPLIKDDLVNCNEVQLQRLKAKPGLTGWSQINGRGDLPFNDRMKLDLYYLERRSLIFDSLVLLKTIWVVLSRRGVY